MRHEAQDGEDDKPSHEAGSTVQEAEGDGVPGGINEVRQRWGREDKGEEKMQSKKERPKDRRERRKKRKRNGKTQKEKKARKKQECAMA